MEDKLRMSIHEIRLKDSPTGTYTQEEIAEEMVLSVLKRNASYEDLMKASFIARRVLETNSAADILILANRTIQL